MGQHKSRLAAILVSAALLGGPATALAQQGLMIVKPPAGRFPHPVTIAEVPPAALQAAQHALGTSTFSKVTEQRGDWWAHFRDQQLYHFEAKDAAGAAKSITVDQDGQVIKD